MLQHAVRAGRACVPTKRMAVTLEGAAAESQDLHVAFLQHVLEDGASPCVSWIPPLHGGGGWHRVTVGAPEKLCELQEMLLAFDTETPWHQPLWAKPAVVAPATDDAACALKWLNSALDFFSPDATFRDFLGMLKSGRDPDVALAQLAALWLYLQKQSLQGTPFWESTTFPIMSLVATARYASLIPEPPASDVRLSDATRAGTVRNWFLALLRHARESVSEGAVHAALFSAFTPTLIPDSIAFATTPLVEAVGAMPLNTMMCDARDLAPGVRDVDAIVCRGLELHKCVTTVAVDGVAAAEGTVSTVKRPQLPQDLPFVMGSHPTTQSPDAQELLKRIRDDVQLFDSAELAGARTREGLNLDAAEGRERVARAVLQLEDTLIRLVRELQQDAQGLVDRVNGRTPNGIDVAEGADPVPITKEPTLPTTEPVHHAGLNESLLRRLARVSPCVSLLDVVLVSTAPTEAAVDWLREVNGELDPREVLGDIARLCLATSRVALFGRLLRAARGIRAAFEGGASAADAAVRTVEEQVVALLRTRNETHDGQVCDPRLQAFEFITGFTLRPAQVQTVRQLLGIIRCDKSCVRQQIMGSGKSSVVAPLLGCLLATGDEMVVFTVPDALLEMSVGMLERVLCTPGVRRKVLRFRFNRYSLLGTAEDMMRVARTIVDDFEYAARARAAVVASSGSLKSVLLMCADLWLPASRPEGADLRPVTQCLSGLLQRWQTRGRLVLDECDVLLHPLRSELIFPVGPKVALELASERVELAHRITAFLQHDPSGTLASMMEQHRLLQSPHPVLASARDYEPELRAALAQWVALWLQQRLCDRDLYLTECTPASVEATTQLEMMEHGARKVHVAAHAVDGLEDTFWCSEARPATAVDSPVELRVQLRPPRLVGAVRIEFESRSRFVARSGFSMVPNHVILLGTPDGGKTSQVLAHHGEFVSRTLYLDPTPKPLTHIVLRMEGSARWFAVRHFVILEQLSWAGHARRLPLSALVACLVGDDVAAPRDDTQSTAWGTAAVSSVAGLHEQLTERGQALVRLARHYVTHVFPHCFGKINRVSYGLLPPARGHEGESLVRRFLAIPFDGKDTPSAASEFSHPDVLVMLTALAYQYEGLRRGDVVRLLTLLRARLDAESGPVDARPSHRRFESWKRDAGLLPLHLFRLDDPVQVGDLWRTIRGNVDAVWYYLREDVFPLCLRYRAQKLWAASEDLGGRSLFRSRVGFSGTPTGLLPRDMGECIWETGTEGRFLRTLMSWRIVRGVDEFPAGWTVDELLAHVARGPFDALIDTGALITGLTNEQVALRLLEVPRGLPGKVGVVYLDHAGRPRLMLRATRTSVPFEQSGVAASQRFTFFDQVHTTGMDVVHAPDACAAITIGKDMVFRDYSQGAWRMRQLGSGQTLRVLLVPEIARLVQEDEARVPNSSHRAVHNVATIAATPSTTTGATPVLGAQEGESSLFRPWPSRIVGWLVLNTLRSLSVQYGALGRLQLVDLWRRQVFQGTMLAPQPNLDDMRIGFLDAVAFSVAGSPEAAGDDKGAGAANTMLQVLEHSKLLRTKAARQQVEAALATNEPQAPAAETSFDVIQQQEREQEQQQVVQDELEEEQGEAWGGLPWPQEPVNLHHLLLCCEGSTVPLLDLLPGTRASEADVWRRLFVSANHAGPARSPPARLLNISLALVTRRGEPGPPPCPPDAAWVWVAVTLTEAASLYWLRGQDRAPDVGRPWALVRVQIGQTLCSSPGFDPLGPCAAGAQVGRLVLRLVNCDMDMDVREVGLLRDAFRGVPGSVLLRVFTESKRLRRRDHLPGAETADGCALRELFVDA